MGKMYEQILQEIGATPENIQHARQLQTEQGGTIREHLIALKVFTEVAFSKKVIEQFHAPYINLEKVVISDQVLASLSREKAEKYLALPLEFDAKHRLNIAMADPSDMSAIDDLKFVLSYRLIPHYAPEDELLAAIRRHYARLENDKPGKVTSPSAHAAGAVEKRKPPIDLPALIKANNPILQLIGTLLSTAHSREADEIVIAPDVRSVRVCLRKNRTLTEIAVFPKKIFHPIIERLRLLLGIEVGDQSAPPFHKGHTTIKLSNNKECSLSYAMYAGEYGEHVVFKIKERTTLPSLLSLGLDANTIAGLQHILREPAGMIFVTGTARSGLTTMLYTLLREVNTPDIHVVALGEPIEYALDGIVQIQMEHEDGSSYKPHLAKMSQYRADVIMIDNVYDAATFALLSPLASRSLILSSFASVDTANAIMKLVAMSHPQVVADYVKCVTSQRLVKKICERCKNELVLAPSHREKLGLSSQDKCYIGKGCEQCGQTGYRGVCLLFEIMVVSDEMRNAIMDGALVKDLREIQSKEGMLILRDDGMRKVRQGVTTVQEILKATML